MLQAWGYANVQLYYDDINGLKWIPKIKTPTLFLSAEDDPFLGQVSGNLQSLCSYQIRSGQTCIGEIDFLYLGCSLLLCRQAWQTQSKETLSFKRRNQMLQYSCVTLVMLGALVTGTALSVSAMRLTSVPCSIITDTLTAEQDQ